jgi:hypothetical protein
MALIYYIAVQGDIIYINDSVFGIRILDASDFSQIQELSSVPHNQNDAIFSCITVSEDYIYYLQDGDITGKRLVILDVSDPADPVEIGSHNLAGDWWFYGFDSFEGVACIAAGPSGLKILNIADPASIEEIGCYDPHDLCFGLAISDDFAFVSTNGEDENLLIFDVSDPALPTEVNALSVEGRAFWISVCDNYLHIPGVEIDLVSGVSVLDISDPADPEDIAFWPCPQRGMGVALSVERYENYAFVAMAYGGVQIYDVSRIDQPIPLGNWTLWDPATNQGFAVRNVKVSWPYLFVPDEAFGLYVLDASDPINIREVASCQTPGPAWWVDLSPDKKVAYVSDFHNGLRIFDISNPVVPIEIGSYKEDLECITHIVASGDCVYLTDSQEIGLHVLDVSDPTAPVEIAYHRTPGAYAIDIALANDLVYLLDMTHFEIFEITSGPTGVKNIPQVSLIKDNRIHSVYPNPFNTSTKIIFDLATSGHILIDIYNVTGQKVQTLVNEFYQAGRHAQLFQAAHLASGTYIIRLETNRQVHSRRLTLVK